MSGLRLGDVILSINGVSMETADHNSLVRYVQNCQQNMRFVIQKYICGFVCEVFSRWRPKILSISQFASRSSNKIYKIDTVRTQKDTILEQQKYKKMSTQDKIALQNQPSLTFYLTRRFFFPGAKWPQLLAECEVCKGSQMVN